MALNLVAVLAVVVITAGSALANDPPVAVADASPTSGPLPLTVAFDGSASYDPQGGELLYDWNFGDGTPGSTEVSPTHTYQFFAGTFVASLRVVNDLGQNDVDTVVITVGMSAECLFVDPGYEGYYIFGYPPVGSTNPQIFTISNTCDTTNVGIYSITLADGSSADFTITSSPSLPLSLGPGQAAEVEVTFTPSTPYFAEATLVIQSNDSVTPEITVRLVTSMNRPPVVDAGPDQTIFVDEPTILQGSATDPDGNPIVDWLWTVEASPEGITPYLSRDNVPTPTFRANVAGDYTLSLVASDGLYWSMPDYVTITVVEILPPVAVADASPTSGQAPLTVQFDGTASYDPQGGELLYNWNFGDGTHMSAEASPTHTYQFAGTFVASLRVVDDLGQNDVDTVVITVTPGGNIKVSPTEYDFGDVELGSSSSTIITITNPLGGEHEDDVYIEDISLAEGSSGDFTITSNPAGSTVPPGGSVDVTITFTPSGVGYISATLEIASNDPVLPLIEVPLGGVGVFDEPEPEGQIAVILSFTEESVLAGTLTGAGSENAADNHLEVLINMLDSAGDLIEDDETERACRQLTNALDKCDGLPQPPDFVAGDAVPVLRAMIEVLISTLDCD
jgi:PKD repeat protein